MFFSKKLKKFENIKHCFFSRKNGFSKGHYASLNCGLGSGDKKENVLKNLNLVSQKIGCKDELLITLNQTQNNKVVYFENESSIKNKLPGDAIVTKIKNIGIGILTADCAPILLYDPQKKIIGCIHSGWNGALNGVIRNTVKKFKELNSNIDNLIAVVGPCIGKESYEVKRILEKNFKPGGKCSTQLKDMNNIIETAKTYNVYLPLSEKIEKLYDLIVKEGKSNLDHSALYLLIKRLKK